jgi:hypothetical protein
MPYRRLPNTDIARLRALNEALKQGSVMPPANLAISQSMLLKLRGFLPLFKQTVDHQRETFRRQTQNSKTYLDIQRRAKLYISHFIQVMNLAVARGELKPEVRKFYGLKENQKTVPTLNTESEILEWGDKIVKGEAARLATGATPVTNPTIALVKVRFEDYTRTYRNQKSLQDIYTKASTKVASMRQEADGLILEIWNQVESSFSKLPPAEMRQKAEIYGVVYVYRKNEKENGSDSESPDSKDEDGFDVA